MIFLLFFYNLTWFELGDVLECHFWSCWCPLVQWLTSGWPRGMPRKTSYLFLINSLIGSHAWFARFRKGHASVWSLDYTLSVGFSRLLTETGSWVAVMRLLITRGFFLLTFWFLRLHCTYKLTVSGSVRQFNFSSVYPFSRGAVNIEHMLKALFQEVFRVNVAEERMIVFRVVWGWSSLLSPALSLAWPLIRNRAVSAAEGDKVTSQAVYSRSHVVCLVGG
jgi:hypothetical protein